MRKYKFFLDFKKEENWLREMSLQGYELTGKDPFGGYCFCPAKPEDRTIRIDYRLFNNQDDFQDYQTLFEDSGWKHIAGSKGSGHQYFFKTKSSSQDDIFSDNRSKAGRYKRLSNMWLSLGAAFLPLFIASINKLDFSALINPKSLYLTPGLWEKSGQDFWIPFIFETPFALLRGYSGFLLLFPVIFYLYFFGRLQLLSRKQDDWVG